MKILHGTRTIDAKYHIEIRNREEEGSAPMLVPVIVNSTTGKVLPEDEPLILFRGQDKLVHPLLLVYADMCLAEGSPKKQVDLVDDTLAKFDRFAEENHDRMKVPD